MDKPEIAQFLKTLFYEFADIHRFDWEVNASDDDEDFSDDEVCLGYRSPDITSAILCLVEKEKENLLSIFELLKPEINSEHDFERLVLVELAKNEFLNGYNHVSFLKFIARTLFLTFTFYYELSEFEYPKLAMYIVADVLDIFYSEFSAQQGFPGLASAAQRFVVV